MLTLEKEKKRLKPSFKHLNDRDEKKENKIMMSNCVCFCDSAKQFPAKVAAIAIWWVV